MSRPTPPFSLGLARKLGSHVKTPQYANMTAVVRQEASNVRFRSLRLKISLKVAVGFSWAAPRLFQISGSGTERRSHNRSSAGKTPKANNQRQPKVGNTAAASRAARI